MSAGLRAAQLCVVSDRRRLCEAAGRPLADATTLLVAQASAAEASGIGTFQAREPDLSALDLCRLVEAIASALTGAMTVLVNDRADIAASCGVGLHLKESSLPASRLRRWLPPGTIVWRAVHDPAGAATAGPVDALLAGTAAASRSKAPGAPVLGQTGLAEIVRAATVPVYAIGGLTEEDGAWLVAAGAAGCAGIGVFLPRPGEAVDSAVRRAVDGFAQER